LYDGTTCRYTVIVEDEVGAIGVDLTADINSSNMRLLYTSTNAVAGTLRWTAKAFPL
jgi:hypothetical protein